MMATGRPGVFRALWICTRKEVQVLLESRALWALLAVSSLLVGHAFIDATRFYAEASGGGGGPAALAQSLSPLDGIVVPVFGAFSLTSVLVFPFVVIRVFGAEKETGEIFLSLQSGPPFWTNAAAKLVALKLAWAASIVPGFVALALWHLGGGHLYAAETLVVWEGYVIRGLLVVGIGALACSLTANASSAAIIALTITLGTWMIDYAAVAQGGWIAKLASYTPDAALRTYERGELRVATLVVLSVLGLSGLVWWSASAQVGRTGQWRWRVKLASLVAALAVCALAMQLRASRDLSEDQRNSFAPPDARVLGGVHGPMRVTIYLAAEDPRLTDFERGVLLKLRRTVPSLAVRYAANSRSGLFETAGSHYGEIVFQLNGRTVVTRSVAEPVVLETLYELLGLERPAVETSVYAGYPARIHSALAPWLFFAIIPLLLGLSWWGLRTPAAYDHLKLSNTSK